VNTKFQPFTVGQIRAYPADWQSVVEFACDGPMQMAGLQAGRLARQATIAVDLFDRLSCAIRPHHSGGLQNHLAFILAATDGMLDHFGLAAFGTAALLAQQSLSLTFASQNDILQREPYIAFESCLNLVAVPK
jgi:hypothetical protein